MATRKWTIYLFDKNKVQAYKRMRQDALKGWAQVIMGWDRSGEGESSTFEFKANKKLNNNNNNNGECSTFHEK